MEGDLVQVTFPNRSLSIALKSYLEVTRKDQSLTVSLTK